MAQRIGTAKDIRTGNINDILTNPRTEPIVHEGSVTEEGNGIFDTPDPFPFLTGAQKSAKSAGSPIPTSQVKPGSPEPVDFGGLTQAAPSIIAGLSQTAVPPTPDTAQATVGAIKSGLGGALAGGLVGAKIGAVGGVPGAVIGGGLGLLFGSVDAYFGVKNSRKQARAAKRMNKAAREAQERSLAEARKWQQINRMDSLEQARHDRNRQKAQDRWTNYTNNKGIMTDILNSNQALANNFRNLVRS